MSHANPTGRVAVTEDACATVAALRQLPPTLALVAVKGKAAIGSGWQHKGHQRQRIADLLNSGEATGLGLLSGPISGGILLVDHDGPSAGPVLQELLQGQPLPMSWQWSSGRTGRWQMALQVPETYWQAMRNKRVLATGTPGEQLELRWKGHQSVLPPSTHPETGEPYRWLPGRSPADLAIAEAPIALIEALLKEQSPPPAPHPQPLPPTGLALPLIEFVSLQTRELITTGGTPGSWNDDQLAAALDLVGAEQWIIRQGCRPTPSARELFAQHVAAAAALDSSFDARRAWRRFDGTGDGATPSTPEATLQERLSFQQRQERRASRGSTAPRKRTAAPANAPRPDVAAPHGKRIRLEPDQVLAMLPARVGTPRLNVRSGDVHLDHGAINGNDIGRLYLRLSNASEKWGKEPTADALMLLASENRFDPVADYLNSNAAAPLPIDQWSRLDQHLLGIDDPIAAEVLPRFLISAVARTMHPGAPVRQTPVLVGPQWRGKTALGRILFGADHWVEGVDDLGRDALMKAHTAWGVELAELDGVTRRADQERLKAFLTERVDTFRAPYDRSPERHARRFVFWATSNAPPLRDPTGSTRFVVIRLPDKMLPLDWAMTHRDAIWARALERYRAGVQWDQCDEATAAAIQERNADHTETDPWTDQVRMILNRARLEQTLPVTVPDILTGLKVPVERQTAREAARTRAIAESLGWQYGRRRMDGGEKLRGFWPAEPVAGPPSGPPGPAPGHPPGHPQNPGPDWGVMVPGHPGHPIQQNPLRSAELEGQAPPAGPADHDRESRAQEVLPQNPGPAGPGHQTDCAATDLPGPPRVAQRVAQRVARPVSDGWPPADQPLDCRPRPATAPGCDLVVTDARAYDVVLYLHRHAHAGTQLALTAQPQLTVAYGSAWRPAVTGGDDPAWGPRPTS